MQFRRIVWTAKRRQYLEGVHGRRRISCEDADTVLRAADTRAVFVRRTEDGWESTW